MNRTGVPDIPSLMEPTVELLRRGVSGSEGMRERLAKQFKLGRADQAWRRFVNNHAWALVRLQTQGRIRKINPGRYELAVGVADATPPIRDGEPLPKWARAYVRNATKKNAERWHAGPFQEDDLRALWKQGGGRCMLTDLPFTETAAGTGQARHPFRPSLDRIDPTQRRVPPDGGRSHQSPRHFSRHGLTQSYL